MSTQEQPDPALNHIEQMISNAESSAHTDIWIGIGSFATSAFCGFAALSHTLQNGSFRGGEVAMAALSASTAALGTFAGTEVISNQKLFIAGQVEKAKLLTGRPEQPANETQV